MRIDPCAVGIDAGYLFSKVVALSASGQPVYQSYRRHDGEPVKALLEQLVPLQAFRDIPVVLSGRKARQWEGPSGEGWIHEAAALCKAVADHPRSVRACIHVGASGVALVETDGRGRLLSYVTNTLCAAGTGSFLDEQAGRLEIDYDADLVLRPGEDVPQIATRCTVFAKSDLIHRQQEGYSKAALWAGLCQGMTATLFHTLLKGRGLPGFTLLTGGVSLNRFVVEHAAHRFPGQLEPLEVGHLAVALGAARHARGCGSALTLAGLTARLESRPAPTARHTTHQPQLVFRKTRYPSFEVAHEYVDGSGNEVRVTRLPEGQPLAGYIGLDIGSTSTKLAVLDSDDQVVCDVYRRTSGEPIEAVRKVFYALGALFEQRSVEFTTLGLATTGSGRKLVGKVFGADIIINEITAHARGAILASDENIETIFEIGGQDAKYIRVDRGQIRDSNMNFVCSAGTGSFVEEQARKLGIGVEQIGAVTAGLAPPATSDRCTVFMEQDVNTMLADGYDRNQAMASVLYSVVKNYLNKVVGNRSVSTERIVFQGATARNKGLVAAFENLLGVEVIVSPYCHVMGCIGAAVIARERAGEKSAFVGFRQLDRQVSVTQSRCELCSNSCRITHANIESAVDSPSWGYLCGRDENGPARALKYDRGFNALERLTRKYRDMAARAGNPNTPVIGLPRSLSTYGLTPFWSGFASDLGIRLKMDGDTDDEVKSAGAALSASDFCFPLKAHLGHVRRTLRDPEVDFVLVPYYISDRPNRATTASLLCPYVESSPSLLETACSGDEASRILAPIIDFRWTDDRQTRELHKCFSRLLPRLSKSAVKKACKAGRTAMERFAEEARALGREVIQTAQADNKPVVVFVGRPYNVRDQGLNLSIPRHFAEHGVYVLPHDLLPFEPEKLGEQFRNIFWAYGQRILSSLQQIGRQQGMVGVYLTNFGCGPDSFLLTYAEELMKDKPFLVLELDEHGSEGGYLTRIEAYLDVVEHTGRKSSERTIRHWDAGMDEFRGRKVWLPPMHPVTGRLFAAVLQSAGYDAQMLPVEDQTAYEIGRRVTRGSECLPTCSTIGQFLRVMKENNLDPDKQAFFMATANGPCRFGQYALLHRMILDREGFENVPIMSPGSHNSYQGMGDKVHKLGFKAFLMADVLFKALCKTRPYERHAGQAAQTLEQSIQELEQAMAQGRALEGLFKRAMARFADIAVHRYPRPLVGIVGEIYVRCNPFDNDRLVEAIEQFGGEAWLAPATEWILYTAQDQAWAVTQGLTGIAAKGLSILKNRYMKGEEKLWYDRAGPLLADRHEPPIDQVMKAGMRFVPLNFAGETILTVGRSILFAAQGADMVVNAAPFGCMPGTLTTAMLRKVQEETRVPMVSMFYDGTPGLNKTLEPYIKAAARLEEQKRVERITR